MEKSKYPTYIGNDMKLGLALVFCMFLLLGSVSAMNTIYDEMTITGEVDYPNMLTKMNDDGWIYLSGNATLENSTMFAIDSETGFAEIVKLESGIWQPTSFEIGSNTLLIGKNVGIGAVGHHVATEASDGHQHLLAHNEFNGTITIEDTQIVSAYAYQERAILQPDNSSTWIGTEQTFQIVSPSHLLANDGYLQTYTTAATEPIRYRIYHGADETADLIFDQSYQASQFPASTEVQFIARGYIEFDEGETYFHKITSDADFSLRMNAADTTPWFASDISFLREDNLLQTSPWINNTSYPVGQYLINNRIIMVSNDSSIQTGSFLSNLDKWFNIASKVAMNYWTKIGNDLSYGVGNVGISNTLIVSSTGSPSIQTSGNRLTINEPSTGPYNEAGFVTQFASGSYPRTIFAITDTNVNTAFFGLDGTKFTIGSEGNTDIRFRKSMVYGSTDILNSGTDMMFINGTSGYVGIGTSSPTQKLDVRGNLNVSGGAIVDGFDYGLFDEDIAMYGIYIGGEVTLGSTPNRINISSAIYYINSTRYIFEGVTDYNPEMSSSSSSLKIGLDAEGLHKQTSRFTNEEKITIVPLARLQSEYGETGNNSNLSEPLDLRIHGDQYIYRNNIWIHNAIGPLAASGFAPSESSTTDRAIDISSGILYSSQGEPINIVGENGIEALWVAHVSGSWSIVNHSTLIVDNLQYDDGTDLQTLLPNRWSSHTLLASQKENPTYVFIYSQDEYSTQVEAEEAPVNFGLFTDTATSGLYPVAKLIIKRGSTNIDNIFNIVPSIQGTGSIVGGANTFQQVYGNSVPPQIVFTSAKGGLHFRDSLTTINESFFTIDNFNGTDIYFDISAEGVSSGVSLDINGNINISGNTTLGSSVQLTGSETGNASQFSINTLDNFSNFVVTNDGNVGIGMTYPEHNFVVGGDAHIWGALLDSGGNYGDFNDLFRAGTGANEWVSTDELGWSVWWNLSGMSTLNSSTNITGIYYGDGSGLTNVTAFNATYDSKADYEFGFNNFNGSGYFTTYGNIMSNDLDLIGSMYQPTFGSDDKLSLYLPFSDIGSTTQYDRSPYGNDGTVINATVNLTNGVYGSGIYFDGTDDYVNVTEDFEDMTNGFTVELWAYPTAVDTWARFIDFGNGNASDNIIFARQSANNWMAVEVYNGSTSGGAVFSANVLNLNEWNHISATISSTGEVFIYKSGIEIGSGTTAAPNSILRTSNLIGKSNWEGDADYTGFMDEVKVYERVLSQEELRTHYLRGTGYGAMGTITADKFRIVNTTGYANFIIDNGRIGIGTDITSLARLNMIENEDITSLAIGTLASTSNVINVFGSDLTTGSYGRFVSASTDNTTRAIISVTSSSDSAKGEVPIYAEKASTVDIAIQTQGSLLINGNVNISGLYYGNGSELTDIGSSAIVDGSITNSKISFNAVNTTQIIDGTIIDADISDTTDITLTEGSLYQGAFVDETGLVLHIPFTEINNTIQYDRSPEINDGTVTGAAVSTTNGKYASGAGFGGADYVTISSPTGLPTGTGDRTIEIMAKSTNTDLGAYTMFSYGTSAVTNVFSVQRVGSELRIFTVADSESGGTFVAGQWHLIQVTYNGTTISAWMDGELIINEQTLTATTSSGTDAYIGNRDGDSDWWVGYIDYVKLYDRVLSEEELRTHYLRNAKQGESIIKTNNLKILNTNNDLIFNTNGNNLNINNNLTLGQKITFAIGETIDSIVDGWIRITGGLNISEDLIVGENVTVGNNLDVDGQIRFPGDTRQSIVKIYDESVGDMFGMEQVSAVQSGISRAQMRLFTSEWGTAGIGFGKYSNATTFVHQMVIEQDGDVGIGVTDPDSELEVNGNIHISSLEGTYTNGEATVCVYDNGTMFARDGGCN